MIKQGSMSLQRHGQTRNEDVDVSLSPPVPAIAMDLEPVLFPFIDVFGQCLITSRLSLPKSLWGSELWKSDTVPDEQLELGPILPIVPSDS